MSKRSAVLGSCAMSLAAALGAAPATAQEWSFSAGVDYSIGDYGLGEDTTIVEAPLTASAQGERWGVSLTVPYVKVEGPGGIAPGGLAGAGGLVGGLLGGGQFVLTPNSGPIEEQGLGDIVASASATPVYTDGGLSLSVVGAASLPTGDETKSLGAGETIAAFSGVARKTFDNRSSLFGTLGYQRAFESETNALFAAAGAEARPSDRVRVGGRVTWSEAASDLQRDALQAGVYAGVDLSDNTQILAYGAAGLSETSPDAAGVALVLRP